MEETRISSLANPKVKHLIKLRQRAYRDAHGEMLIEGCRECRCALDNHYAPHALFHCVGLSPKEGEIQEIINECRKLGATLYACTPPVFQKIAYRKEPGGVIMVGPGVARTLSNLALPPNPILLVAEAIEKPGNLGAILRAADAAGASGVIVCDRCTDIHNPNVVRASTGTLFSVPVIEADSGSAMSFLSENNFTVLGATPHATSRYFECDLRGSLAIVVGSEQHGLTERWLARATQRVRIPMLGMADSLNVAAATTILLFEAVRQRDYAGDIKAGSL